MPDQTKIVWRNVFNLVGFPPEKEKEIEEVLDTIFNNPLGSRELAKLPSANKLPIEYQENSRAIMIHNNQGQPIMMLIDPDSYPIGKQEYLAQDGNWYNYNLLRAVVHDVIAHGIHKTASDEKATEIENVFLQQLADQYPDSIPEKYRNSQMPKFGYGFIRSTDGANRRYVANITEQDVLFAEMVLKAFSDKTFTDEEIRNIRDAGTKLTALSKLKIDQTSAEFTFTFAFPEADTQIKNGIRDGETFKLSSKNGQKSITLR